MQTGTPDTIGWICQRRSHSPKRLGEPAPTLANIERMIAAAVTGPDHEGLRPWRFIAIAGEARDALGEVFARAKRARDPGADEAEIERERDRGRRPPLTLVIVLAPVKDNPRVPAPEQYASAGAALQNILLAARALGFGAKMLSGAKTKDAHVRSDLGIGADEEILGFVCMGTPTAPPKEAPRPAVADHLSFWTGAETGGE